MEKVHIERLRTLYAMVAGIPERRMDLNAWRRNTRTNSEVVSGKKMLSGIGEPECGTVGCAVGWATLYPEFVKEGLRADCLSRPVFLGHRGWFAVECFFGLSRGEAETIFSNHCREHSLSAKRHVLKQIRLLLLKKGVITPSRSAELSLQEEGTIIA